MRYKQVLYVTKPAPGRDTGPRVPEGRGPGRCRDLWLLLFLVLALRLPLLPLAQFPQRRVHPAARDHWLVMRIRLQLFLFLSLQVGILMALTPLVVGRAPLS